MRNQPGFKFMQTYRQIFKCLLLAGMIGGGAVLNGLGVELHVAPNGNDAWSGTLARPNAARNDGPLATLTGARNAIRRLKARGQLTGPVNVLVADGTYPMEAPLELGPEDSGTAQAPISYRAAKRAHPIFTGGIAIKGWQPGSNGLWHAEIPDVAAGRWYFEQLWVNGHRAIRARTPNKFCYYLLDVDQEMLGKDAGHAARQTVRLRPDDFKVIANLSAADLKDLNLVVYQHWDVTRRLIDRIDPEEQSIITSGAALPPWNPWVKNSRFMLENALSFLDSPGEWFLSRTGTLYYQPLPGESMANATVVAPKTDKFIVIRGDLAAGKFVQHIQFQGLSFQHAQWLTPPGGFEPSQAAATIDAVVMADGARHVVFDHCQIQHIGTYGIWLRDACQDNAIRHCQIEDLGAGGVRLGPMAMPNAAETETARNTVDNCILRHGGRIFACAVGVWIGFSPENHITHNEIADFFYTGISAGWSWGYGQSNCKRNEIAYNDVHHLGWGLLSDMGGIYTLGLSEGTVVRGNVFHDIYSHSYGGWGLYTDEGSSGILFEDNLVYHTKTGSFHQHYGEGNILRNNILADSLEQQLQATRAEDHLSFTFERNIIYWTNNSPTLAGAWLDGRQLTRSNCYWNAGGFPITFLGKSLAEWQRTAVKPPTNSAVAKPAWAGSGRELGSIIADPQFVNPAQNNFQLKPGSPALALGFKPFDYSQAGVYGDAAWRALARRVTYPPLEVSPPAPFAPIHAGFEHEAVGKAPKDFEVYVDGHGDSLAVTDETAATGRHSVKFTDAPGLREVWLPHLCARTDCREGLVHNSFALRLGPGANVNFEWRDWSQSEYRTGPQFRLNAGKLWVNGKSLMEVPLDQWIRFEVAAGIGSANTGKWTLKVFLPGQPAKEFSDLPFANSKFQLLTWIGFTSDANAKTVFYLDDFDLTDALSREP